jgi:hypothetical protein
MKDSAETENLRVKGHWRSSYLCSLQPTFYFFILRELIYFTAEHKFQGQKNSTCASPLGSAHRFVLLVLIIIGVRPEDKRALASEWRCH